MPRSLSKQALLKLNNNIPTLEYRKGLYVTKVKIEKVHINSRTARHKIFNFFSFMATTMTPWRNGSASDFRSEGCVFESRRGQIFFNYFHFTMFQGGNHEQKNC